MLCAATVCLASSCFDVNIFLYPEKGDAYMPANCSEMKPPVQVQAMLIL
jgi:hypothetical protein